MKKLILSLSLVWIMVACKSSTIEDQLAQTIKPPAADLSHKERFELYQEKLEQIKSLISALCTQKNIYVKKITLFQSEIQLAKNEIYAQMQANRLTSLAQAQNNQAVKNNLEVIQKADAYIGVFNESITRILQAITELQRLEKLTRVDTIALDDIDDDQAFSDLLKKLDQAVSNIQPDANKLVTSSKHTNPQPIDVIWKKYIMAQ